MRLCFINAHGEATTISINTDLWTTENDYNRPISVSHKIEQKYTGLPTHSVMDLAEKGVCDIKYWHINYNDFTTV